MSKLTGHVIDTMKVTCQEGDVYTLNCARVSMGLTKNERVRVAYTPIANESFDFRSVG